MGPDGRRITIDYGPMPHQVPLHQSEARFRVIVGGRRVGKSKSCLHEVLRHCFMTQNGLAWWVAPTYTEAREVGLQEFIDVYEDIRPAVSSFHRSNMKVVFTNGSRLYFKGADRRDSLRGRGLTFCMLDEVAFIQPDIWYKVIRPALSDRKGRAVLATTPNGRNWLHALFTQAASLANWERYHWPSALNPLMTADELDDARATLSDMEYRQEFLGEFVNRSGKVYSDFGEANQIDVFKLDPTLHEIFIGADFGYANPAAILFFAVDRRTELVTQWDEIYGSRMTMEDIEAQISLKLRDQGIQPRHVAAVFTDPAGNAEEITSGISPVDSLRKTFRVDNKGTEIAPGLALVRSYIKNAKGDVRFRILRKCVNTINSFEGYCYPPAGTMDASIKEVPFKDGLHDHACDAVRYFFVNRFDNAKWLSGRLKQTSYIAAVEKRNSLKRCAKCRKTFFSTTPKDQPPFVCGPCEEAIAANS